MKNWMLLWKGRESQSLHPLQNRGRWGSRRQFAHSHGDSAWRDSLAREENISCAGGSVCERGLPTSDTTQRTRACRTRPFKTAQSCLLVCARPVKNAKRTAERTVGEPPWHTWHRWCHWGRWTGCTRCRSRAQMAAPGHTAWGSRGTKRMGRGTQKATHIKISPMIASFATICSNSS